MNQPPPIALISSGTAVSREATTNPKRQRGNGLTPSLVLRVGVFRRGQDNQPHLMNLCLSPIRERI